MRVLQTLALPTWLTRHLQEPVTGNDPVFPVYKTGALPLSYTGIFVRDDGIGPPQTEGVDLPLYH